MSFRRGHIFGIFAILSVSNRNYMGFVPENDLSTNSLFRRERRKGTAYTGKVYRLRKSQGAGRKAHSRKIHKTYRGKAKR